MTGGEGTGGRTRNVFLTAHERDERVGRQIVLPPLPDDLVRGWTGHVLRDRRVRHDLVKYGREGRRVTPAVPGAVVLQGTKMDGGSMCRRTDPSRVAPAGYRAVLGLEAYGRRRVDGRVPERVKPRASMINGRTCCIGTHGRDALPVDGDRIAVPTRKPPPPDA